MAFSDAVDAATAAVGCRPNETHVRKAFRGEATCLVSQTDTKQPSFCTVGPLLSSMCTTTRPLRRVHAAAAASAVRLSTLDLSPDHFPAGAPEHRGRGER